jgi:protein gp37
MATETKIQWADHSASPWYGCSEVHLGCDQCYARELAKRNPSTLGTWGPDGVRVKSKSFIRNLRLWQKQAAAEGRIVSVFPSLCDPFEDRPELEPWRREMFETIDQCPNVRLLLLTKRPENVRRMWPAVAVQSQQQADDRDERGELFRRNCCLLASISDQPTADAMVPELLKLRDLVPVLGLSVEPLLGPVRLRPDLGLGWQCERCGGTGQQEAGCWDGTAYAAPAGVCDHCCGEGRTGNWLKWVIVGGESGPKARTCDVEWVRSIVQQCQAADVPVFVKQLGANVVTRNDMVEDQFNSGESGWPDPAVEYDIHGFREDYQGADCRIRLRDPKGGDPAEWPEDLRLREFPEPTE